MSPRNDRMQKKDGRERLLATARDLFRRRGAANVGINEVIDAAGVARMTLYNNFPSKDALTLAVYRDMTEETLRVLRSMPTAGRSEEERVFALFDHFEAKGREPGSRGCPFLHASLQAAEPAGPVYALVHAYKRALRQHVLDLLDERRANRADLADQLLILLDGMVAEDYLRGVAHPADSARRVAKALLQATA